jgi:multimeric flavodoxin WrbA
MKVVSVFGSPHKKGNTATVLGWVEEELINQGHDVDRINVTEYKVNGCLGCYTCHKKPDEPGCPQKNVAVEILNRMIDADAIIYASPMFCWSWAGQIKPLIDRHFCLVTDAGTPKWKSLITGKPTALVMTSAGPVKGNADMLIKQFDSLAGFAKASVVDRLAVPLCTTPDAIPDNVKQQEAKLAGDLANHGQG